MRCADCKFWEMDMSERNFGVCKANAPSPSVMKTEENDEYKLVWPLTGKDDWCGQFKSTVEKMD